jgi:hypothetical protein
MNSSTKPGVEMSSIPAVSPEIEERARKNHSILLNRLGKTGQKNVGDGVGLSEASISKMKDKGDFERFGKMIALMGLKVVPVEMKVVDMNQMEAVLTLAKKYMALMESSEKLTFEEF